MGLLLSGLWYQYTLKPVLVVIGLLVVFGIVFLIPKSRRWISNAAQWIAEKLHFLEQWEGFLNSLKETVSKSILLESAGITVLAYISQIALFNLCLRGLNLDLPLSRLIFAYFLPTVLGVLSTLPAGIGVTDASMVGILASASNTSRETAAVAIIFFRLFTVLLPALLGFMLYFLGWRGEEESLDE